MNSKELKKLLEIPPIAYTTSSLIANRYRVVKQLAQGGESKIMLVQDVTNGVKRVVKLEAFSPIMALSAH